VNGLEMAANLNNTVYLEPDKMPCMMAREILERVL